MKYREQIINEYVERIEEWYTDHSIYSKYLEEMEGMDLMDLKDLTKEDVGRVIKPFLYKWGRMGRVLGRNEFKDWESDFVKKVQSNYEKLENFRTKNLVDIELTEFESDIKKCYDSFKETIGQIAAAKVLHLICPNFFPLWDNDIAKAIRNEYGEEVEDFSGADYYRFMQKLQDFIKEYEGVLSDLVNRYRRGKLKILDEFLWAIAHRPLSIFF